MKPFMSYTKCSIGSSGKEVNPRSTRLILFFSGLIALFISAALPSPVQAKECGGNIPCECGDSLVASRTMSSDPVQKTICPENGLSIDREGVTLVIKKAPLMGTKEPKVQRNNGAGIIINAPNVTIEGGRIRGFKWGIIGVTNDSTIFEVKTEDNAVHAIFLEGDRNTIELTAGSQSRGPGASDGILVSGNNNQLIESYSEKSPPGAVAIHVIGTGNLLRDNLARLNQGGGILVQGGGNIDDGGNEASKTEGTPQCEIDGFACEE
jgi:hypothetical protein